jgi:hypothetical protein
LCIVEEVAEKLVCCFNNKSGCPVIYSSCRLFGLDSIFL